MSSKYIASVGFGDNELHEQGVARSGRKALGQVAAIGQVAMGNTRPALAVKNNIQGPISGRI